jgi:hypothetical protein
MPGSSADFWNPEELRYRFLAECRRLWEREQSRNHIANVQAAAIISHVLNCDGVDKIGFRYLRHSIHMAADEPWPKGKSLSLSPRQRGFAISKAFGNSLMIQSRPSAVMRPAFAAAMFLKLLIS